MIRWYDGTRCGLLDRTCKALVRKLWGGSCKTCGHAPAAHRGAGAKLARFTLACAFCLSFRQAQAPEQRKNGADESRRLSAKFVPSSCENREKALGKQRKTEPKSMKNRSWLVLGVQSRSGGASERVRDGPGRRQSRAGSDLGTPRASQERPGDAQERARDGPKTLPGPSRATSECVRRDNHSQTRHRNDFSSILSCRAKAPMC